jgi:hypothetical protein
MKVKYVRLFSDKNGESHFSDEQVELESSNFAPPAPPLFLSAFTPVTRLAYLASSEDWTGDWHPAPHRQFMIFISGDSEIQCGDGETRHFGPGSVLLAEDTSGKGHYTKSDPGVVVVVQLTENARLFQSS